MLRNTPAAESLTLGNLGFRDASVAMMVLDEGRNSRQRLPPFCFLQSRKRKRKVNIMNKEVLGFSSFGGSALVSYVENNNTIDTKSTIDIKNTIDMYYVYKYLYTERTFCPRIPQ